MAVRIALFNNKGGVSKTTTTFNLGWMLASKGKRVILVDADPQTNLSGLVLGLDEFERLAQEEPQRNIRAGVAPAFEAQPRAIEAINCVPVKGCENLFLLPGSIRLAEYEVTLGIAQELSGTIQTLKNLPGAFAFLLDKTAEKYKADYVLIDLNPSLSSLNQNLLMTSNFFIIPTSPDYFSVMAIESLAKFLPNWYAWAKQASSLPTLQEATYPFPVPNLKLLGTVIQKFRPKNSKPTVGFQYWINEINEVVVKSLVPVLNSNAMLLPTSLYEEQNVSTSGYCLENIPDFNTLIAQSQKYNVPVFALNAVQLEQVGKVLDTGQEKQQELENVFADFADKVINLTNYANALQPV